MDPVNILILIVDVLFVEADVQLTQYGVRYDYSAKDCTQLLPCGSVETLEVQRKSECVLQALQNETDRFFYGEEDNSCLLCLQADMSDGIAEAHSSQLVYVKGLEIYVIW